MQAITLNTDDTATCYSNDDVAVAELRARYLSEARQLARFGAEFVEIYDAHGVLWDAYTSAELIGAPAAAPDYNDPDVVDLEGLLAYLRTETGALADWDCLCTFGGRAPADTFGVLSWDRTRLLIGDCAANLEIVPRTDV